MKLEEKKILITGASKGIGNAILKKFYEEGAREFAVAARKKAPLDKLKDEFPEADFLVVPADVSKPEDIKQLVGKVEENWGKLDILVNNAGVVSAGLLPEISDEDIINQININVTGLILLTKKSLPLLKESNEGAIINISSGLGYLGMPFYSVYAATKAAVRQFSDSLRRELFDYPLHVMTVYPTVTDTSMMENAKVNSKMDSPEEVAQATLEGLNEKEINVILGGDKRKEQIEINFNNPRKMDELSKQNFDAMRERTENHRAM